MSATAEDVDERTLTGENGDVNLTVAAAMLDGSFRREVVVKHAGLIVGPIQDGASVFYVFTAAQERVGVINASAMTTADELVAALDDLAGVGR